ncbi:MAG: phosphoribosylformylglycinamidine synthase II, partial [Firmicutes bacterium]|nr:phosphoribosylformylglycinamidine synthase II [Bacillota bacterium]
QTDLPLPEDYHAVLTKLLDSPNIASKDWIYQQFDYEAQGNTVVGPGYDAAVLTVPGTDKMIAVSLDGNSLHCYLDPYQGAAGSVAEAARNVVCVGGRPLGLTNGLNFGSPENPESYWQLNQAIEGIAAASRALGIPVTGGNVSLYNETGGKSIYPTPIIGVVGLIEGDSYCPVGWQKAGDVILLLGSTQEELGGSEYLSVVHGLVTGKLPQLDLEAERRLLTLLLDAHEENLLASAHDLSHGGLAVALVECCLSSGMGAQVELPPDKIRLDAILFGETPSRVVVSCSPQRVNRLQELASEHGVPCLVLGEVGEQELVICQDQGEIIDMSLKRARDIYSQAIPRRLQIG